MARAPRTLADGRIKLVAMTKRPADPSAPTVEELKAGVELSCRILKSDYKLTATASDTLSGEAELCATGNSAALGPSNYEASISPFRYLDGEGKADPENDVVWDATKVKGTTLFLVEREGPLQEKEWAAGDEISVYEVITDTPQKPSDRGGYIKRVVPMLVQQAWENVKVAA